MTKKDLLLKIVAECYRITNNSKTDVWFNYNAHVDTYDVSYSLYGYPFESKYIDLSSKVIVKNLQKTLKELDNLWELIEESNLKIN